MESYRELRDRQQKEFNELPLGFAFSDKQFDEMMGKWGLDPEKDLQIERSYSHWETLFVGREIDFRFCTYEYRNCCTFVAGILKCCAGVDSRIIYK